MQSNFLNDFTPLLNLSVRNLNDESKKSYESFNQKHHTKQGNLSFDFSIAINNLIVIADVEFFEKPNTVEKEAEIFSLLFFIRNNILDVFSFNIEDYMIEHYDPEIFRIEGKVDEYLPAELLKTVNNLFQPKNESTNLDKVYSIPIIIHQLSCIFDEIKSDNFIDKAKKLMEEDYYINTTPEELQ